MSTLLVSISNGVTVLNLRGPIKGPWSTMGGPTIHLPLSSPTLIMGGLGPPGPLDDSIPDYEFILNEGPPSMMTV